MQLNQISFKSILQLKHENFDLYWIIYSYTICLSFENKFLQLVALIFRTQQTQFFTQIDSFVHFLSWRRSLNNIKIEEINAQRRGFELQTLAATLIR